MHFILTDHGLEFTISHETGSAPFTTAYLPRKICETYDYNYQHLHGEDQAAPALNPVETSSTDSPKHGFGVHLGTMLDCLTIFGNNPGSVSAAADASDHHRPIALAPGAIPLVQHHSHHPLATVSSGANVKMAYIQQGSYLELM